MKNVSSSLFCLLSSTLQQAGIRPVMPEKLDQKEKYAWRFTRLMWIASVALPLTLAGAQAAEVTAPGAANIELKPGLVTDGKSLPPTPPSFADLVERVRGAVVSIQTKAVPKASPDMEEGEETPDFPGLPPGFRDLFRNLPPFIQRENKRRTLRTAGSGFFISADGYVVTNYHVIADATNVTIVLENGRKEEAKVVGVDSKTDLALLKLNNAGPYPFVQFSSEIPRVGDWVLAVGNPFELGGTVTLGIISARGRDIGAGPYDDYLQIDAPVNRGNSGGPAFNTKGEVVGVNTAILSPSGGSVGIGFAISAQTAQTIIAALQQKGSVTRGWIGVEIQPVTEDIAISLGLKEPKGALVANVVKNGPAAESGIKSGDVILRVNNESVESSRDLSRKIASMGPETKVDIAVWRNGKEQSISLKLGAFPQEDELQKHQSSGSVDFSDLGLTLTIPPANSKNAGEGVLVAQVDPEGLAGQSGLRPNDIITEVDGTPVKTLRELKDAYTKAKKDSRPPLLQVKSPDGRTRYVALAIKRSGQ